jgi:hypothetical protein
MSLAKRAVGSLAFLLGIAWSGAAAAFCRTTTCDTCEQLPGMCVTEGVPLDWASHCMSYDVQKDGSKWATYDQVVAAADKAFAAWQNAMCSGGAPSFRFSNRGPIACDRHEYNDESHTFGGNANIIVFHDDGWSEAGAGVIALTTVSFGKTSGRIYDADIEINGLNTISVDETMLANGYDLQSIITHEAGHFLGLAHATMACSPAAGDCPTMSPSYPQNSTDFRSLEQDDVDGICSVYPTNRQANDDTCEPCNGFASECGTTTAPSGVSYPMNCATVAPSGGCSLMARGARTPARTGALGAALIGLALFVARRRRR